MRDFFSVDQPIYPGAAPGRLDVMGGIADYSGSLLLQMPLRQHTRVQLQFRDDDQVIIHSANGGTVKRYCISTQQLTGKSLSESAALIRAFPGGDWAVYPLGCLLVFARQKKLPLQGIQMAIRSQVPLGKGVSSSASLEVAVMRALFNAYQLVPDPLELPLYCQQAENQVVGAPCGLMDQLSSHLGQRNQLLPLICQPHQVLTPLKLPRGLHFCAIDSGVRHAVTGASYADVRTAAFMGYSVIARQEAATVPELEAARQTGSWESLPYGGYLANISPSRFQQKYQELIPEKLSGAAFTAQFGASIDKATTIDPDRQYGLRAATVHPIAENFRIGLFRYLLKNWALARDKEAVLRQLGEFMYQSHAGYHSIGLGHPITDRIVERVLSAGSSGGVYGARISGGGSGGTVVVLCYGSKGLATARSIHAAEVKEQGGKPLLFFP